jgi:hypothetical protein
MRTVIGLERVKQDRRCVQMQQAQRMPLFAHKAIGLLLDVRSAPPSGRRRSQ